MAADAEHLSPPSLLHVDLQGTCHVRPPARVSSSGGQRPLGAHRWPGHRGPCAPRPPPPGSPHLDSGHSGGTRRSGRLAQPAACAPRRSGTPRGLEAGPAGSCPPPRSALGGRSFSPPPAPQHGHPLGFAPGRHLGRSRWCGRRLGPRWRGPWRWSGVSTGPWWRSRRLSLRRSRAGGPSKARAAWPRRPAPWCRGTRPAGPRTAAGGAGVSAGALPCPPPPGRRASPGTGRQSPPGGGGWPRPRASGCHDYLTVTTGACPPSRPVSAPGAVSLEGGGVYTAQTPTPGDPPSPEPPRRGDRACTRGPPRLAELQVTHRPGARGGGTRRRDTPDRRPEPAAA